MPELPGSDVRIEVNGQQLWKWVRYDIESDILQLADAFSFTIKNPRGAVADAVHPGDEVQVLVDGTLQMTGVVDSVEGRIEPDSGPVLEIVGRDRFGQLLDESANPEQINGKHLQHVAEILGDPWVTRWRYENEVARLQAETIKKNVAAINAKTKRAMAETSELASNVGSTAGEASIVLQSAIETVDQVHKEAIGKTQANLAKIRAVVFPRVKIEPGESKLEVIQRLATKAGLHVWMAPDGSGVMARPNYSQAPSFIIQLRHDDDATSNNVLSGGVRRSTQERYRTYRAVGHSANTRSTKGSGSRHDMTVSDSDAPLDRTLITSSQGQNRSQVREQLERDRDLRKFNSLEATYRMRGHRQGDRLWSTDSIVSVDDHLHELSAALYCTRRRFSGSLSGQHTEITLKQKGIWLA